MADAVVKMGTHLPEARGAGEIGPDGGNIAATASKMNIDSTDVFLRAQPHVR